ncbi:MAG TPA: hypothetical protein PKH43_11565 [Saprospiraceae bacterium]|nr:hypothetical protein [Saprospiraceae bacterium]
MKKSDVLALIANDEIAQALELSVKAAVALGRSDWEAELVLLQSQWGQAEKEGRADVTDPDEIRQQQNKVKKALIALVQGMPEDLPLETPAPAPRAPSGVAEGRFKWRLLILMLLVKGWIVYWILFHQRTGGFTNGEALATIALLLPAFAAYISPMLADMLRQRTRPSLPEALEPRVSSRIQWLTLGLVLAYGVILHTVIGNKAAGRLADEAAANFENMTKWLAIVESGLGVYIGLVVGEFFKKNKS